MVVAGHLNFTSSDLLARTDHWRVPRVAVMLRSASLICVVCTVPGPGSENLMALYAWLEFEDMLRTMPGTGFGCDGSFPMVSNPPPTVASRWRSR